MNFQLKYPLRELLDRAIAGDYSHQQLGELHKLVYLLARGYVRMRARNGRLPLQLLGLSESDVVHDCIAEIFRRNGTDELVEISRYFEYHAVAPGSAQEEQLTAHLRNLVFTVAGDNIFRMLNEADPVLGKIIRNLKLATQKSNDWTIETRFEDKLLALRCHNGASHRDGVGSAHPIPTPGEEEYEPFVYETIANHHEIPEIMSCLAGKLRRSGRVCAPISLITFAVMIKTGLEKNHPDDRGAEEMDAAIDREELAVAVRECCVSLDRSMRKKYVGRGRVTDAVFSSYIAALLHYFEAGLAPDRAAQPVAGPTYYESLHTVLPSLSRGEYLRDHRTVFEYLARRVKTYLRGTISRS